MFKKVLIANRGEIARRIIRTLRKMNIKSVAVYSDSDKNSPHVLEADESVYIGADPATQSYLNITKIVSAALETDAEAVHPGYGFLAESLEFARALKKAEIVLIGPDEKALQIMGDKARSRDHVAAHNVPVVPGFNATGMSDNEIAQESNKIGFPLLIKPSAGGGGKGMEVVASNAALKQAVARAKRVAVSAFGDESLIIEKLIAKPRHIEVQIFADKHGNVYALGERECTLQRRHQKVIEEAPTLAISNKTREKLFTAAINTAKSVSYIGAGTVEFLIDADKTDEFFFIEMNTRLQVEHPVTEAVTGLDLVQLQINAAAGQKLSQLETTPKGFAVEARIYAESPENDFMPSIGKILSLKFGANVRVDSAVNEGSEVSPFYDPMIAKIIAHAKTREEALKKLDKALKETVILGVETNIGFLRSLLKNKDVLNGTIDTGLINRLLPYEDPPVKESMLHKAAAAIPKPKPKNGLWGSLNGWRLGNNKEPEATYLKNDLGEIIKVTQRIASNDARYDTPYVWVSEKGYTKKFESVTRRTKTLTELNTKNLTNIETPECLAPMPGTVVTVHVEDGAKVQKGDPILSIEAMKMEHPVSANKTGIVKIKTKTGEQVQKGALVAVIES